ncbi:nucleotide-diphospho-sugar transferase [Tanacetum coccineum]
MEGGLVQVECQKWASKGKNIHYQVRDNRKGYKAGALKEGLKHQYANECEYVAIFDADFQPEPDFLLQTIPYHHHNPELGLVQTRWKFVNSNECLMTRMQEMSLDYHFKVEQESGSSTYAFFGFNGTAGVWRMAALDEAGGWKDRTTVEDMDLAVRATLKGWKFLYLGNIKVKNELPSTFKAFRYQQHRWSCGPANLFRKMVLEIIRNKSHIMEEAIRDLQFLLRKKDYSPYCYVHALLCCTTYVATPRSFHLVIIWILFENVMSLHRTKATFIGLFETNRVNEWVVTEKHGDASKDLSKPLINRRFKISDRLIRSPPFIDENTILLPAGSNPDAQRNSFRCLGSVNE